MKRCLPKLTAVLVTTIAGFGTMTAEEPAAEKRATSRMKIDPCSSSLAGGKAKLVTSALRRDAAKYVGNYDIKVNPYFFKNEKGTLSFDVSDDALRKLATGEVVDFSGRAVSTGTGKSRPVKVKVMPAGAGGANGNVTISIATVNGELVFKTGYSFVGG